MYSKCPQRAAGGESRAGEEQETAEEDGGKANSTANAAPAATAAADQGGISEEETQCTSDKGRCGEKRSAGSGKKPVYKKCGDFLCLNKLELGERNITEMCFIVIGGI